jgi:hypothetical protein
MSIAEGHPSPALPGYGEGAGSFIRVREGVKGSIERREIYFYSPDLAPSPRCRDHISVSGSLPSAGRVGEGGIRAQLQFRKRVCDSIHDSMNILIQLLIAEAKNMKPPRREPVGAPFVIFNGCGL